MSGWTNRGKAQILKGYFANVNNVASNFQMALVTSATAPTDATNVITDLTEVSGSGYARQNVPRTTSGFTIVEDDVGNDGTATLEDCVFTASGGSITARYAVLLDDQSTPNVLAWWPLNGGADVTVSSGQSLTVHAAELELTD